jgi:branched-subunit amino acid aminotransferase/4-amino-4-deoxychorismate lyase
MLDPTRNGSILNGITRRSIVKMAYGLARSNGEMTRNPSVY